jgi:DNA-binding transcriptional LysR family regulator
MTHPRGPFELRELEAFVAVATHGSFTRAAVALAFDQSTISRHVQQLERALRVTLLTRTPRDVELTRDGRTFLPYAEGVLVAARRATEAAAAIRTQEPL